MERTIMISDIHGCIDQFDQMLNRINYNSTRDQLILLGDYVDRGPNSKEVVERVMELVHVHNAIALRGNHDQRLVDLVKNPNNTVRTKFLEHGGKHTLQSYCGKIDLFTDENLDQSIESIKAQYSHHIDFLEQLPLYYEDNHHIYVHAGINPKFANWKDQPDYDFMYIKEEFIKSSFNLDKKVIFGHTRTVEIHGISDIWFGKDKIGIDGGCAYGLQLNALIYQDGNYTAEHI